MAIDVEKLVRLERRCTALLNRIEAKDAWPAAAVQAYNATNARMATMVAAGVFERHARDAGWSGRLSAGQGRPRPAVGRPNPSGSMPARSSSRSEEIRTRHALRGPEIRATRERDLRARHASRAAVAEREAFVRMCRWGALP